jgi:abortive infection bacteriophage resistance protein
VPLMPPKKAFAKPATTHQQQIALLKSRGMLIPDEIDAECQLTHINYYRLGAYWLPFERDHATHQFTPGTSLARVLSLYQFDRNLRLLVMDALETIEISVRSQWSYCMAHHHGPHAHLDPSLSVRYEFWQKNKDSLAEEVARSDEIFIRHLMGTYAEPLPPVWAACEVMSLGLLSRWYNALKPMRTRSAIASVYGLDERVFQSWLHHLTTVRNCCAHHSRLWNREFTITPAAPIAKPRFLAAEWTQGNRHIYNSLLLIAHLLSCIKPHNDWPRRLISLTNDYSIDTTRMGFPLNWKQQTTWQEKQI